MHVAVGRLKVSIARCPLLRVVRPAGLTFRLCPSVHLSPSLSICLSVSLSVSVCLCLCRLLFLSLTVCLFDREQSSTLIALKDPRGVIFGGGHGGLGNQLWSASQPTHMQTHPNQHTHLSDTVTHAVCVGAERYRTTLALMERLLARSLANWLIDLVCLHVFRGVTVIMIACGWQRRLQW